MIVSAQECLITTKRLGLELPENPNITVQEHVDRWSEARAIDATLGLVAEAHFGLEEVIAHLNADELLAWGVRSEAGNTRRHKLDHIGSLCENMSDMTGIYPTIGVVGAAALGLIKIEVTAKERDTGFPDVTKMFEVIAHDKGASGIFTAYSSVFLPGRST